MGKVRKNAAFSRKFHGRNDWQSGGPGELRTMLGKMDICFTAGQIFLYNPGRRIYHVSKTQQGVQCNVKNEGGDAQRSGKKRQLSWRQDARGERAMKSCSGCC